MTCERCGGGALICSVASNNPMRCPDPTYDNEFDLLGVCQHLVMCPECREHPGYSSLSAMRVDQHRMAARRAAVTKGTK